VTTPSDSSYLENTEPKTIICTKADCHLAGIPQPRSHFYAKLNSSGGLCQPCKDCSIKSSSRWYANNKERGKSSQQKYRRDINNWAKRAIISCRKRANNKGPSFNIEISDLLPLPQFCPFFGIPLDYKSGPDRRRWASVDKIKPELGYVKGNVRIISSAANWAKNDGDDSIFSVIDLHHSL
jgi:hypothetical protein